MGMPSTAPTPVKVRINPNTNNNSPMDSPRQFRSTLRVFFMYPPHLSHLMCMTVFLLLLWFELRRATGCVFQSPRCRGASSDGHPQDQREKHARRFNPLDAGALLQTAGELVNHADEIAGFQSPRCRGASSDTPVGTCPMTVNCVCFNPLDAGALLQTHTGVQKMKVAYFKFQSPRCRGASSDRVRVATRYITPPEFQSPRCRGASSDGRAGGPRRVCRLGVSIPSMPGRFFRPDYSFTGAPL